MQFIKDNYEATYHSMLFCSGDIIIRAYLLHVVNTIWHRSIKLALYKNCIVLMIHEYLVNAVYDYQEFYDQMKALPLRVAVPAQL